jgi:hypothetical protein
MTRRTVVKTSSRGRLYLDWEPMPRVPDKYLECVVYLYTSIPAAQSGERVGGTGFIVGVNGSDEATKFFYVVTNKHVIEGGSTTVRFNTPNGIHEAFEFDESNWFKAKNADLAIYLLPNPDPNVWAFSPVSVDQFVTRENIAKYDIGIGDEVFFAGRFINAEGKDRNRPSLRFGTIAQDATDEIDGEESFLVEARSIPGYSGSPVFVYLTTGVARGVLAHPFQLRRSVGPWLLGVDWSHINDYVDAKDKSGNELPFKIRSNSGMMGVVPIWKLHELLYREDVRSMRQKHPRNERAATPSSAKEKDESASRDSAVQSTDANPTHREDFNSLLGAAVKTPESKD